MSRFWRAQRLPSQDLQVWRNQMLSAILSVTLVLGSLTALPSILLAFRDQLYSVALIDFLAIGFVSFLWSGRALSFTLRSWGFIFTVFSLGIFFLLKVGPVSQIYLMAAPIFAALLLGLRASISMLILNAISLLFIGYFFNIDLQFERYQGDPFLRWIIITLNFTFISSVLAVSCAVLLRRFEESLRKQVKISHSLKNEQSSLKHANEELRLISAAVENLNDMVMIAAHHGAEIGPRLVFVNRAFEDNLGYTKSESLGQSFDILFGINTDASVIKKIHCAISECQSLHIELRSQTKAQNELWLEVDFRPIHNNEGICTHYVVIQRDITARKNSEMDIHRLAFYDVLTGLPNRRLLQDRMQVQYTNSQRHGQFGAILFIDLDHFKTINDARGHSTGDRFLIEVAHRLSATLRESDTVARISGDEFVVVMDCIDSHVESASKLAMNVAEKLRFALSQEFTIDHQTYHLTCSIGVSLFPKIGQNVDDLLREADTAMYRAKMAGRNQIAFYEGVMQDEIQHRLSVEHDLSKALVHGELHMYMQLQVNGAGQNVGAELLMRWNSKERGMVSPAVFIPLAEESGLIIELGEWVLSEACRIVKLLRLQGHYFPLSINVSPKQFRQNDFVQKVRSALLAQHVSGENLIFEVTEGLFIEDIGETIVRMNQLADLGIRFSIDDFGTGYSSLNYLKKLPLYELKIDKSFVQDVPHDANGSAIVLSILSVAKQFDLKVVAEGVETQAQAQFLIANQCDSMQGFLYSKPTLCEAWLRESEVA
jgi:diguanylate cyclase (GGDEF)-like protein/PAS domain S-box-containing protein